MVQTPEMAKGEVMSRINSTNLVVLTGFVGNDPFVHTNGNSTVANFSLALNRSWVDERSQKHERVDWMKIVGFNNTSEIIKNFVKKGRHVMVTGSLRTNEDYETDGSYSDRRGNWLPLTWQNGQRIKVRQKGDTYVDARKIEFMDSKIQEQIQSPTQATVCAQPLDDLVTQEVNLFPGVSGV